MDSAGSVPGLQSDRGGGPICPGTSEGKPHVRCRGLGKGGCARRLAVAIERQRTPSDQLQAVHPPAAGDERQGLAAGAAEEQLDGS